VPFAIALLAAFTIGFRAGFRAGFSAIIWMAPTNLSRLLKIEKTYPRILPMYAKTYKNANEYGARKITLKF
jgi:hypothetical protein